MVLDVVDLNQKINNRSFTIGWLLESLRANDKVYKKLHGERPVKEVSFSDISGGKGFVSIVLQCIIHFADSTNDQDVYSTILKIPGFESFEGTGICLNEEAQKSITEIHQIECNFYIHLAKILDVPIPKMYKTIECIPGKQDGCIHMEDLSIRGKNILFFDNINLTQVKCFIRHLAHMHKKILSVDPEIWKGKYVITCFEAFENLVKSFDAMAVNFMQQSKMKDSFEPLIKRYHKFGLNIDFMKYADSEYHNEQGIESVITHGDMHSGNIMWALNKNGDIENEIIGFVDWQIMHESSPIADLARFLVLCADGIVRRQAEDFAIDYYLECLLKEFGGDSSKIPYTADKLKKAYKISYLAQAFLGIGIAAFLVETQKKKREISQSLKNAYRDFATLKAFHIYEDVDKILKEEEMKDVFAKYGK